MEELSDDNEVKQKTIENLTSKLEILHQKLAAAEKAKANETDLKIEIEAMKTDKRHLEKKHVTCSEMKELKNEKEEFMKDINNLKVCLK